jgi:hypothetical protein
MEIVSKMMRTSLEFTAVHYGSLPYANMKWTVVLSEEIEADSMVSKPGFGYLLDASLTNSCGRQGR